MKFYPERFKNTRFVENLHIFFWLIKDTSWVMEFKVLGVSMIVPTVFIAALFVYKTVKVPEFFSNLSVLFWIIANSFWMCAEFFNFEEYKHIAAFPFTLGFLSFFVYIYKLNHTDTNK